ncbi:MAG: hypothetical protein QGG89_05605, partial [Vicinamibacterales bacterium]|nr:hypothetical protein [Vicinamibacterales bacterium]
MQTIARGITYTDLQFLGLPRVIATAVLQSPAGVALVDPGPSTCLDTLRAALTEQGISRTTFSAVLPINMRSSPALPRAPMTTRSASISRARLTIWPA